MEQIARVEAAIDAAIKPYIEYIARGLRGGGFPIDEESGEMQNWSAWIARRVAVEATEAANATR